MQQLRNILIWILTPLLLVSAHAQIPSLINIQGRLIDGTNLVNGSVAMTLTLYDDLTNGTALYMDSNAVTVVDGLYATYLGDDTVSGSLSAALTNGPLYLETTVNGITLVPREQLVAVSYAMRAGGVTNGAITSAQLGTASVTSTHISSNAVMSTHIVSGAVTSTHIQDSTITAADLDAPTFSNTFWKVDGNAGLTGSNAFVGTTDNQPLELRVNNTRMLRLEYAEFFGLPSPNIIGGHEANSAATDIVAAVIGGGGIESSPNQVVANGGVIGGGLGNIAGEVGGDADDGVLAVIGGGENNRASGNYTTIGGGRTNNASRTYATIGGGRNNTASGQSSFIGGGWGNTATNTYSSILAGLNNESFGQYATVLAGQDNAANGDRSLAAGYRAHALHDGAFVWADAQNADFSSSASNQFLIRSAGGVGIGTETPLVALRVAGSFMAGNAFTPSISETGNIINILSGNAGTGGVNGISFWENSSGFHMSLGYDGSGSGAENAMYIYNDDEQPLVRFENGGHVGIGVDNATAVLEVQGGDANIPVLHVEGETETGTSDAGSAIMLQAGSGGPGSGLDSGGAGGDIDILGGHGGAGGIASQGGDIDIQGGSGWGAGFGGGVTISGGSGILPGDVLLAVHPNGNPQGNVGIGTDTPLMHLHVLDGDISEILLSPTNTGAGGHARIVFAEDHNSTYAMYLLYDGDDNQMKLFGLDNGTTNGPHWVVNRDNGRMGINTENLGTYTLSVGGGIRAEEVVVETGWADFVFEPDYPLPSLDDVKHSIEQHRRLPDMPSAEQIQAEGAPLGAMQTKLLQKIEELTLYTLQQQEELAHLRQEVESLREELNDDR